MAEITKITTPMIPNENAGKYRPVTDQAFTLTDPTKVHKSAEDVKVTDHQAQGRTLSEYLGRAALEPLLKSTSDLTFALRRMVMLVETGISTSEAMNDPQVKEMIESLFMQPEQMLSSVLEQENASVLFRGAAFDALREILGQFEGNTKLHNAIVDLLKTFEHNVNTPYAMKSVLVNSASLLDYMFSHDRQQFQNYLEQLGQLIESGVQTGPILPESESAEQVAQPAQAEQTAAMSQRGFAAILKNNLLPLLGEIVVKYHQNSRIRDIVMVVVHNIVRVDKGTPEALRDAVDNVLRELRQNLNLPQGFEQRFAKSITDSALSARLGENQVIDKLTGLIAEALRSPNSPPATLRQAEALLFAMLQDQSNLMNVLHFILPVQTPSGQQTIAELYVDPESNEHIKRSGQESSRKLFLSFESEEHGSFEMSFLQSGDYIEFDMWCPDALVPSMNAMKRHFSDIIQMHGYTLNRFGVQEYRRPQSVAEVFPRLMQQKVGIDVRI